MLKRNHQIGFIVTAEEKKRIEESAKKRGMTVSTYLRWLALASEKGD